MAQIKVFHITFLDGRECFELAICEGDVRAAHTDVKAVFEVYS